MKYCKCFGSLTLHHNDLTPSRDQEVGFVSQIFPDLSLQKSDQITAVSFENQGCAPVQA